MRRFFGQALGLAVIMTASLGGYLLVLKWRGGAARFCTQTTWDEQIPLEPGWVWVYLLPYLVAPLVMGLVRPIKRGLAVVALSLIIFICVPTKIADRSTDIADPSLTGVLYTQMVTIDEPPANAAPSLHVSLTFLLALALWRDFPKWWPVTAVGVILVWLATLFTHQHHLLDVATGILLASLVCWLWPERVA
jgi:membrane-associated phospholipid phosphatase